MRRIGLLLVAAGLAVARPHPAGAVDANRYGNVQFIQPSGEMRGMVILYSGRDGWGAANQTAADALARMGALVAAVDTRAYVNRLDAIDEGCHVLIGDAEALSREAQRTRGSLNYFSPILVGVDEGGTLAGQILEQAAPNTIAGVVSVDPAVAVATRAPACSDVLKMTVLPDAAERAPQSLQGFWSVGLRPDAPAPVRARLDAWAKAGAPIVRRDLPAGSPAADALAALIQPHLQAATPTDADISGLPLVELPADHPASVLAVVLSGDGGWRDIDKTVADGLQASGISVVGLDSLRYFWHLRTADQLAKDLATILRVYMARWHIQHVVLIGYSFGADVAPFAFNRLPDDLRNKIDLIALLALSQSADFEISVTGWLGAPPTAAALPVTPEIERIRGGLIQCFYGQEEDDSDCPALVKSGADVIATPGGHHFNGDYDTLVQQIRNGIAQRVHDSHD
jgi:type IV secretory pathway VirJ component